LYGILRSQKSTKLETHLGRALVIIFIQFVLVVSNAFAQGNPSTYADISFFVCAHQDDWQLFMGSEVYNTIQEFDAGKPEYNKRKVVIIYTTAGNLHDDDDSKSCSCIDPKNPKAKNIPYWQVREDAAKNSTHFAGCRFGSKGGAPAPYPENRLDVINGHLVTNYQYKNTSSYFLRLKAGEYSQWGGDCDRSVGTVDSSTTYIDFADLVNTIYYIYKKEMNIDVPAKNPTFSFPDVDTFLNPDDHPDHYLAGKAAGQAAKLLSDEWSACFPEHLYVDYDIQNLPENLSLTNIQNKTAITSVYCLSLLDHNAWAEWSKVYREWSKRSYFRSTNTCDEQRHTSAPGDDGSVEKLTAKLFPNPADKQLLVKLSQPFQSQIGINISDIKGNEVFAATTRLDEQATLSVNTAAFPAGSYLAVITAGSVTIKRVIFQVRH
jgi:hypothetical protein